MEHLTFSQLGQWTLHKSEAPRSDYRPNSEKYRSYTPATAEGRLPNDHGQKGVLHAFPRAGRKPAPTNARTAGKVPHEQESAYNDRNPGVGN